MPSYSVIKGSATNIGIWALVAVLSFHAAFFNPHLSFLIGVTLFALFQISATRTPRQAFYSGLAVGMACYGPQLGFFWTIFGPPAVVLWLILSFWMGLFLLLAQQARRHWPKWGIWLVPFFWIAAEYTRSELYYLKFSWLSLGYALAGAPGWPRLAVLGLYGVSLAVLLVIVGLSQISRRWRPLCGVTALALFALLILIPAHPSRGSSQVVNVAVLQVEFRPELEIPFLLDRVLQEAPQTELIVLPEYTFDGPVPMPVRRWCKKHQIHLIAGGKDPVEGNFFDTAFVVDPQGEIIFRQAKSVPIQFFRDGLPAREQAIWDSPWGRIGLCICYDLSYSRVTDELIRLGVQALIVPTMDLIEWGGHEHALHGRVGIVRAAEYHVPVVRSASSGVSQVIDASGRVLGEAPFPQQETILHQTVALASAGRLPLDRTVAPVSVTITAVCILFLIGASVRSSRRNPASTGERTDTDHPTRTADPNTTQ